MPTHGDHVSMSKPGAGSDADSFGQSVCPLLGCGAAATRTAGKRKPEMPERKPGPANGGPHRARRLRTATPAHPRPAFLVAALRYRGR